MSYNNQINFYVCKDCNILHKWEHTLMLLTYFYTSTAIQFCLTQQSGGCVGWDNVYVVVDSACLSLALLGGDVSALASDVI